MEIRGFNCDFGVFNSFDFEHSDLFMLSFFGVSLQISKRITATTANIDTRL